MDVDALVEKINHELALVSYHDKELVEFSRDQEGDETYRAWEVTGTLSGGRRVKLEFRDYYEGPSANRYAVWLYDAESGEPMGRGNGGPSWQDAIDIYQWRGIFA
ncbi:hypothetical protein GCM10022200_05370 [Microbacterium awajiense]|uniref:Uncharacterized protein n=1 Tax=Microbacterium awajiense TaxID=415214 RepID=A0ABP7A6S5_9MICO